ncbi:sensor histidine kinase AgrC, partial [Staphylococcus warneri]
MDPLNFLPFASIQTALLIFLTKTIVNLKFYLKDYLFSLGLIILSTLMYFFLGNSFLLFLVALLIIFFYRKIKLYSIIVVLISNL